MTESDNQGRGDAQSQADRTLLGVAPPRVESTPDSALRSPVFVRSGTSVADVEPPPVPRIALPSRPPRALDGASEAPPAFSSNAAAAETTGFLDRTLRVARKNPILWMVAAPAGVALAIIGLAVVTAPAARPNAVAGVPVVTPVPAAQTDKAAPSEKAVPTKQSSASLAELEAKPEKSLTVSEVLQLAAARAERRQQEAEALRDKVARNPSLLSDKATQAQLLSQARDEETARAAQAALAGAGSALGADLLYEVWTGTSAKTDATELARALVQSPEVRPKASPALSVALDLRAAETCEQVKSVLPSALKDGDRRSLHLLAKLGARRGCGPNKAQDCYACLRDDNQELAATINAVKARRPPAYPTP